MEEFQGEDALVEKVRDAVAFLYGRKIKSGKLERMVRPEAQRMGWAAMSRQDIDKFRKGPGNGGVGRPNDIRKIYALWNVVSDERFGLPTAQHSGAAIPVESQPENAEAHEFFQALVKFFDIHQHRNARAKTDIVGRLVFYIFSEIFHKFSAEIPRAVVVGQWDIAFVDGAFCIEEKQDYDGHLGKQKRKDVYNGYCLPKGRNLCFLTREAKAETPKFYILEAEYDDPDTFQVHVLSGHMLKGSRTRKFFHSPVYAVRVPDGEDVECNIVRC